MPQIQSVTSNAESFGVVAADSNGFDVSSDAVYENSDTAAHSVGDVDGAYGSSDDVVATDNGAGLSDVHATNGFMETDSDLFY